MSNPIQSRDAAGHEISAVSTDVLNPIGYMSGNSSLTALQTINIGSPFTHSGCLIYGWVLLDGSAIQINASGTVNFSQGGTSIGGWSVSSLGGGQYQLRVTNAFLVTSTINWFGYAH